MEEKDYETHYIDCFGVYRCGFRNFTLPAFHLLPKESKEIELNWENEYGKLSKGTYRIIKGINYEYEEGKYKSFNVAVEFIINRN